MPEDEDEVAVEEQQPGEAAARVQLPCLSNSELNVLQQQLQQQLQQLFFNPSAEAKAAANRWLLQFQRSLEAWQVARHVLEEKVLLRVQQQQQDEAQPGSVESLLEEQLLLLAAQTLAWKVMQQPDHLSLEEKKQLAIFLLQLSAGLQQQQQRLGPQLLGPLLSRLSQCIAHCAVHCAEVWGDAVADIVAFACSSTAAAAAAFAAAYPMQPAAAATATATASAARAAAVRPVPAAGTPAAAASLSVMAVVYSASASSPISLAVSAAAAFFTLPCCLALWSLAAIPDVIKSLDAPTRGCRRATETPQALRCERHTKAVLDLVADVLLARAAVETAAAAAVAASGTAGGASAAAASARDRAGRDAEAAAGASEADSYLAGAAAPAGGAAAASAGGERGDSHSSARQSVEIAAASVYQQQQQEPQQRMRQRWCVEEGILPLLVNWMGLWEQPYLQHQLLCEALAAVISPLAAEPALTDCLVAATPRLSSYMQLWNFTTAALPPPARNGSTNAVLDGLGRSSSSSSAVAAGGGASSSGGAQNSSSTDAQQQLLLAWADPGLPTGGGEGLLCNSMLQQLLRFSAGLAVKERTQQMLLLKFKQCMLQLQQQQQQQQQQQRQRMQQAVVAEERRQLSDLQQQLSDGAELALLLRWGSVLQTVIEGFPAVLLEDPAAAARFAAATLSSGSAAGAGGSASGAAAACAAANALARNQTVEGQAVCGELLLQLWRQQPQTWLCASNVWGVIKELRRDQLLPPQVLQLLLQRLAPTCISCLLQHCRRDSPWWRWKSAAFQGRSSSGREDGNQDEEQQHDEEEEDENTEEWNVFVDSAGDTACDLFFLYDACGGEESRAFLQSLGESMQQALQQGDAAGAEVLLLLTDALVEGLNCIPVPLASLFLCLPALPRTSAPCAAAVAKLLKKAAIHFTEEDPEYDGLLTAAPHALETATPCGAAMLKKLWMVALQTLLQLLPLHPRLGADSILQLATWGGHHLGAATVAAGTGWDQSGAGSHHAGASCGAAGTSSPPCSSSNSVAGGGGAAYDVSGAFSFTLRGKGERADAASAGENESGAAAAGQTAEGGSDALQQLEMFCAFVEETGPRYAVQVDATLHAAAVKLVLTSPRKDMPALFNRSMRGTRQLLQRCLVLEEGSATLSGSPAASAAATASTAAAAVDRRRYVSRVLQRLESCCSALCGGKVCVSRSSSSSAAAALQATGGGAGGGTASVVEEEEEGREAAAALQYFLAEDNIWMALLQVMRATLLKTAATALPTNAATKQRVHFGLLIDLKSREPLQHPQDNDAVLMVLTIRCLRLLLRGLGTEAGIVPSLWAAVAELVSELVSNALLLVDRAAAEAAAAAGTGGGKDGAAAAAAAGRSRSSSLGAQAALQACGVVLLGDLLRIAAGGKSSRDAALLQAAKAWAARGLEKITLLFVRLGLLLNGRHNHYDVYSPYFDFLLAYAAAATACTRSAMNGGGGTGFGNSSRRPFASSSSSSSLLGHRCDWLGSSNSVGSGEMLLLQQDDLYAQPGFESTLRVAVETLQHQDADIARQCIVYCHTSSTLFGVPQVGCIIENLLPQVLTAILNNLHCWGLENLSVLWKAFALWSERYHTVFLRTVSEWLAAPPSSVGGAGYHYASGCLTSSGGGAGGGVSAGENASCSKASQPERLSAPQAAVWRGFQNRSLSAIRAAGEGRRGGGATAADGRGRGSEGDGKEEEDGAERLLRGMDAAQKEVVICSFRSFRGARMRQLLQDLCLIASGAMLPSDALVAYEYALQTEQKTMAKEAGAGGGGAGPAAESGGACSEIVD